MWGRIKQGVGTREGCISKVRAATLLCAVLCLPGCRRVFPYPAGGIPADGSAADTAPTNDTVEDTAPDRPDLDAGPPKLSCSDPMPLGEGDSKNLLMPAISSDGLTLYATMRSGASKPTYMLVREATDRAFSGDWTLAAEIPEGMTDLGFFEFDHAVYLVGNIGLQPNRELQLCKHDSDGSWGCDPLEISGAVLDQATDFDGATVAVTASGPLMLFNAVSGEVGDESKIYRAAPDNLTGMLSWTAGEVETLDMEGPQPVGEDDPAITADGRVVVLCRRTESGIWDLYWAYQISEDPLEFSEPMKLEGEVNKTTTYEGSPEIYRRSARELELFFVVQETRELPGTIYYALCSI